MKERVKCVDFSVYCLAWIFVRLPERLFRLFLSVQAYLSIANRTRTKNFIRHNLDLAFPQMPAADKRRLSRKILFETGFILYQGEHLNCYRIQKSVEPEGFLNLDEALAKGKGVVVFSAHLGNFALLLSYLSRRYPVKAVVSDSGNPYIRNHIRQIRKKAGIVEINRQTADASVRESLNWLRSGHVLLLLADEYRKKGITVPFFNILSGTQTGPAVFARRLGCALVPVSIVRRGKKHLLRVEPALTLSRSEDRERDIRENTALCNRVIEKWVREDPAEWFGWLGKRFVPAK